MSTSQDGKSQLVVFQRYCGATTGFSTQVSLLPVGIRKPEGAGNTFIADTNHGAAPSGPGGGPRVQVAWQGNRGFVVRYQSSARVFKAETMLAGYKVAYVVSP